MARGTFLKLLAVTLVLPLLGVGCSRERWGDFLQSEVVAKIKEQWRSAQERTLNAIGDNSRNFVKNLTAEQKQAIAEWLKKNKLNQYGDTKGTVYVGGTPLFNEATGETINRYEYLFKKFSELKEIIKKARSADPAPLLGP